MSFKQNFIKNGLASGFQKTIRIFEQLLLVPFFITAWGPEYYGEWITLTIIPTLLGFTDLGFGTAAGNKMVLQYASGDRQGAANTSKTGLFVISLSVILSIFLSLCILIILDSYNVFSKSLINRNDALFAVSFLMLAKVFNFYQQLYEGYFRSARKASHGIVIQAIYAAANLMGGLFVLLAGKGIVEFAIVTFLISVVFNPIYIFKAKKILPLLKDYQAMVLSSEIISISKKGLGYVLSPVWQVIFFQGTTFVVRVTLGPLAVAVFNTVRTLTRSINQIFQMITRSALPEMQFEIGSNNLEKARKIFRTAFFMVMISAFIGILFLYFFGPRIYELWTQKALDPPKSMWNIFLAGILFHAIWWTSSIIFQAFNKPFQFTLSGVIVSVLAVFSTYFLSNSLGLTGAAIGGFIMDFVLAIYLFPKGCKLLEQPLNLIVNEYLKAFKLVFKNFNMKRI